MTYTFKLARRLAVSRCFGMLPALLLFAACNGGDAIAPDGSPADVPESGIYDWRPRESTPVAVRINPSSVTLETNQLIRFRARGHNRAGDTIAAPVVWTTTGGTILPDGRFSAAAVGTYEIVGRARTHEDDEVVDTSIVTVVRRQIGLVSLEVTPGSATLTPGLSQAFGALGRVRTGTPVPVGAHWSATGGTIDAGGTYVAGDTAGTYRVIATNTTGSVADTATITIGAPPTPPPPPDSIPIPAPPTIPVQPPTGPVPPITPGTPPPAPEPPPPPAPEPPPPPTPTLQKVTLMPATVTLAPATKKQFVAYGRNTAGDSVAVTVTFSGTGGTVTAGGLYTAGSTGGTFRIIATTGTLADTSTVTVTNPLNSGSLTGIPIGTFHLPIDRLGDPSLSYNGATMNAYPATLLADLAKIKAKGARVMLAMRRATLKDGAGLSTTAGINEINSWPDISSYIADGTVIGIYIADDIGATEWGSYSRAERLARWDAIGGAVRARWPDVAVVMRAKPSELAARSQWDNVTTAWAQYKGPYRDGSPESYRDAQVAAAKAMRMGLVLWLNVLDGGCGITSACMPGVLGTDIRGTYVDAASVRRFQMSAAEVLHYGTVFINEPYNCAAIQWRWSPTFGASLPADQLAGIQAFDTRSDVRSAMASLSVLASQRSKTSCRQGR